MKHPIFALSSVLDILVSTREATDRFGCLPLYLIASTLLLLALFMSARLYADLTLEASRKLYLGGAEGVTSGVTESLGILLSCLSMASLAMGVSGCRLSGGGKYSGSLIESSQFIIP